MKFITRSIWYKQRVEPILGRIGWFEYMLLKRKSALANWGWFESRKMNASVDQSGLAIPWYTYSFLDAMTDRIPSDARVFEYGSGNSTNWWAERTSEVHSVEHDEGWFYTVIQNLRKNARIVHLPLHEGQYARSIQQIPGTFDIIIIDGRDRNNCAMCCLKKISERGVIIWDNTERARYADGIRFLKENGFRQLRFTGFIPIDFMPSETSVFYRDGNCLGI